MSGMKGLERLAVPVAPVIMLIAVLVLVYLLLHPVLNAKAQPLAENAS